LKAYITGSVQSESISFLFEEVQVHLGQNCCTVNRDPVSLSFCCYDPWVLKCSLRPEPILSELS